MTRENLNRMHELEAAYNARQYANVPEHARPRTAYKDNSANSLTRSILDFIKFSGGYAERVQRMGFRVKAKSGREIWVSGGGTNGTADISAIVDGRSYRIEVKYGTDRIRPNQLAYEKKVKQAGAVYFVARSMDQFIQWWEGNVNSIDKNQPNHE